MLNIDLDLLLRSLTRVASMGLPRAAPKAGKAVLRLFPTTRITWGDPERKSAAEHSSAGACQGKPREVCAFDRLVEEMLSATRWNKKSAEDETGTALPPLVRLAS
jgi:hypothetical protein